MRRTSSGAIISTTILRIVAIYEGRTRMQLKIEYLPLEQLKPYVNNAKLHPAEQVEQIKKSIEEFGFDDPIAIWGDGTVIEGHGRLIAATEMGLEKVPVIRLDHLTDEQRRAYTLVHNKLTMNSGFDSDMLALELEDISELDMGMFGFAEPDVGSEPEDSRESSFVYHEQYGVIVICESEQEQEKVYERLTGEGLSCKVVAT